MTDTPTSSRFQLLWTSTALLRLTLRSLLSRTGLTLLNLFGMVLAVALLSNAAFFAQGVDRAILQQELTELSRQTGRDPFSLRVYVFPSSRSPLSVANAEEVGDNLAQTLASEIGLPEEHLGIQVESGGLMLLPMPDDDRYTDSGSMLGTLNVVYVADVAERMEIIAGVPLDGQSSSSPDVLDVWMHVSLAEQMGVHPGETFQLGINVTQPIGPIRIQGLWRATDATDSFWFKNPDSTLKDALLVRRADYVRFVEPVLPSRSRSASWHISLNAEGLNPMQAQAYVLGFDRAMAIIDRYLPSARLDISPLEPLKVFVGRQSTLTNLLLAFNIPALAFLLYFMLLVSAVIARRQRREISILRSRGMSKGTLMSMALIEQGLLACVAVPVGVATGLVLARLMGYTTSFLSFSMRPALPVSLQGFDLRLVLLALVLTIVARLVLVAQMAASSAVEQERAQARQTERPFWQRAYLDLLLILPTVYVYRQLLQRGTFADPTVPEVEALFQDPLLILAPALFVVTAAVLLMRLFGPTMSLLDWLAGRTSWLTPHLVLRQLGRHSAAYVTPLLLVIVLLAMGIYTVSMAASLDQWLVDRVYYRVGTHVSFMPIRPTDSGGESVIVERSVFNEMPGVATTARVGDYPLEIQQAGEEIKGRFLAVDRLDFGSVAWFRADFAGESLGGLMNRLAASPESVLVSQAFLQQHYLQVGDPLALAVSLDSGIKVRSNFTIAGVYTYFPTVYADDVVVIGNLETLFLMAGAEFPHHLWLRLQPGVDAEVIFDAVTTMGLVPGFQQNATSSIREEQSRLERVGIFGTLSVGFAAAGVLAILSLLVHGFASLGERVYQFGVLRALGLMHRQVLTQVSAEYALIIGYGAAGGAVIGALTAFLFVPFFRITGDVLVPLPPLIPLIAWDRIVILAVAFTVVLVLAELIIVVRSLQQRVFTVLRLGNQG